MGGSAPKRKAKSKKNAKAGTARAAGPVTTDAAPDATQAAAAGPQPLAAAAEARPVPRKAKPAKKKKAAKAKPAKRRPEAPARRSDATLAAAAADAEAAAPAAPTVGEGPASAPDEASAPQITDPQPAEAAPPAEPAQKPGRGKGGKAAKPRKVGAKKARSTTVAADPAPPGDAPAEKKAPARSRKPARAPKPRTQYGALLHRRAGDGVEIMLVSSRETRRWIIPKGWPIKGLKAHEAAAREAFEEAGVEGRIAKKALGDYPYGKRMPSGAVVPCRVRVFPMVVERERLRWPEMYERSTRWLGIEEAAGAVTEPELADLIRRFGTASSPGGDQPGETAAPQNDDPAADAAPGDAAD